MLCQLHPSGKCSQPFALMLAVKANPETNQKLAGRAGCWCRQWLVPTSTPSRLQSCCISLEALLQPQPQPFLLCYSSHACSMVSSVQDCGVTESRKTDFFVKTTLLTLYTSPSALPNSDAGPHHPTWCSQNPPLGWVIWLLLQTRALWEVKE